MTPSALLAALARLHLAPPEAARLLGYNKTSVYRWIRGAATVPPCVERVLWACEMFPGLVWALEHPLIVEAALLPPKHADLVEMSDAVVTALRDRGTDHRLPHQDVKP